MEEGHRTGLSKVARHERISDGGERVRFRVIHCCEITTVSKPVLGMCPATTTLLVLPLAPKKVQNPRRFDFHMIITVRGLWGVPNKKGLRNNELDSNQLYRLSKSEYPNLSRLTEILNK